MSKPQGGLGRGLGALIPQKIAPEPESEAGKMVASLEIIEISPDKIKENPHQPRKHFSPKELEDLIASIKEHGILQPLVVTRKGDGYELIAGERRLRASRMLALEKVPAIVREATDQQKLELALIENIQRSDLNAVEEALAYQSLTDLFSMTQEEVAKRVGKSRSQVANTIRLLELDQEILDALAAGQVSRSHARTLLAEPDLKKRHALFKEMLSGNVTVREAEARAGSSKRAKESNKDPNVAALEAQMREMLGTKVSIKMKEGRGSVTIHFYSKEDFKRLMQRLAED